MMCCYWKDGAAPSEVLAYCRTGEQWPESDVLLNLARDLRLAAGDVFFVNFAGAVRRYRVTEKPITILAVDEA